MASKRTEAVVIAAVGALGLAVAVSKATQSARAPTPPPAIVAATREPMSVMPQPAAQGSRLKSRQMSDADRGYHDGALASQARAFGGSDGQAGTPRRTREVEGMTQAARDAGYDEVDAEQLGREAAALCNGDRKCLE